MKLDATKLRAEAVRGNWSFSFDDDERRVLLTTPGVSVSCTISPNGEGYLYAAGPFDDVLSMIRVLDDCVRR